MKTILFLAVTVTMLARCGNSDQIQIDTVWMTTDPIQCLNNAWEEAWLKAHPDTPYPVGKPRVFEEQEQLILRAYFLQHHDVTILRIRQQPYPDTAMVCAACSCPAGYSLYIEVTASDKEKLEDTPFEKARSIPQE